MRNLHSISSNMTDFDHAIIWYFQEHVGHRVRVKPSGLLEYEDTYYNYDQRWQQVYIPDEEKDYYIKLWKEYTGGKIYKIKE